MVGCIQLKMVRGADPDLDVWVCLAPCNSMLVTVTINKYCRVYLFIVFENDFLC